MADAPSSIEERAENGEHEQEAEEFFPRGSVEHDGKGMDVIFRKHRAKVETTVALSRAEVPLRGVLVEPDADVLLLVRGTVSHYVPRPTRDEDGKQDGWKVQTVLRSAYVESLGSEAQAIEGLYRRLIEKSPEGATEVLAAIRSIASEHLAEF